MFKNKSKIEPPIEHKYSNASIIESVDKITIIGDSENLAALGHALILKAKLKNNLSCIITDGHNRPIEIFHIDDLEV